jgi:hypothetical protein
MTNKSSIQCAFSLTALTVLFAFKAVHAASFDCTVQPREEDAFEKADYRLWLPEDTPEIRGILFRQHGCGPGARMFGLEHANDIQWQALAQKHGFALMGSQLWAPEEDCSTWTMPEDGSANAFLNAIGQFAKATGHPELETVPWCLWGHSGGAIWTVNMCYLYPERIIAAFPRSGGLSPVGRTYERSQPKEPGSNPATFQVPILFCYGEKEYMEGNRFRQPIEGVYQVFEYGRTQKAPWTLAIHPESEHENSQSRQLALRYFDQMIEARLPDPLETPTPNQPTLRPLPQQPFWIGKHQSLDISEEEEASNHQDSYLLNHSFARDWQAFSKTGNIPDTTAPPRPHNLRVECEGEKAILHWEAFADIESGIQGFTIYRKGKKIGTVGGEKDPRWNPTGAYHAWNYSDQPLHGQALPPKTFLDPNRAGATEEDYQVTTVNKAGIESNRTQAISLSEWNIRTNTPWKTLIYSDGKNDWEAHNGSTPKGWRTENGILNMRTDRDNGEHTALYLKETYGDFEFQFEYRIGKGGNSGVKYRMTDYDGRFLGPEYQILDDEKHYPGYNPATSQEKYYITATLYVLDMGDWSLDPRHPPGTWNRGRILSKGTVIEHWLNGVKIVETRTDTEAFKQAVMMSKFAEWPHYGQNTEGKIMLQDHGTGVEYKNLRIKRLP